MDPFIGEIRAFGFNYAPVDWASCDGSLVAISQNQALFAIIGCTFGGNCQTTMGLPNLKDRAVMGIGAAPGLTPRHYGEYGGSIEVSLLEPQIPSHTHQLNTPVVFPDNPDPENRMLAAKQGIYTTPENLQNMAQNAMGVSGSSVAHENRQPYLVLNFCVCLNGIWPSRP